MLNRFKNALYGPSDSNQNNQPSTSTSSDVLNVKPESGAWLRRSLSFQLPKRDESCGNKLSPNERYNDIDKFIESVIREERNSNAIAKNGNHHTMSRKSQNASKEPKYSYRRPKFLQLKTDDEICVSADHQIRPIILPRDLSRLPWDSGYAECINAGKSTWNEDQAACHQDIAIQSSHVEEGNSEFYDTTDCGIPWVYFGMFDGHAGNAVAVAAAEQLHHFIGENLKQVADMLIALEFGIQKNDEDSIYVDCSEKEFEDGDEKFANSYNNYQTIEEEENEDGDDDDNNNTENEEGGPKKKSNKINSDNSDVIEPKIDDSQTFEKLSESMNVPKVEQSQPQGNVPELEPIIETLSGEDSICNKNLEPISENESQQKNRHQSARSYKEKGMLQRPKDRSIEIEIMKRSNITVDSLVIGALESAFWQMDTLIGRDKFIHKMPGGCTAVVSLFILGKLYVCNAGDSRAIVCRNNRVTPMSFDFTPISEKERILRLGLQRPELLGSDFTPLEFLRRPSRQDLGTQMLYKDASMKGWSMKEITEDDLRIPLVWGEGKRSRAMATIGVTRGFGDHELKAQYGPLLIKPFLTPEPEVRIMQLENDDSLKDDDVLIMGTDGLWDVTSNEEAAEIVKNSIDLSPCAKYRFMSAAQDLVLHSRGENEKAWIWRKPDESIASLDDVSVFVIPLKQYRDNYLEWKRLRISKGRGET